MPRAATIELFRGPLAQFWRGVHRKEMVYIVDSRPTNNEIMSTKIRRGSRWRESTGYNKYQRSRQIAQDCFVWQYGTTCTRETMYGFTIRTGAPSGIPEHRNAANQNGPSKRWFRGEDQYTNKFPRKWLISLNRVACRMC